MMKTKYFGILLLVINSFSETKAQTSGILTDPRDGKNYKTIQVGNQIWMTENLNFETKNSWCAECETHGRIYNFEDAKVSCPPGWHLPSTEEWDELIANLGGKEIAGGKMKSKTMWKDPSTGKAQNTGATDEIGFAGKPARYRTNDGKIREADHRAAWWTSSEGPNPAAWSYNLYFDKKSIECTGHLKNSGFSVRCVKDYIENPSNVSKEEALKFLNSFEMPKQLHSMASIYINESVQAYNNLLNGSDPKIDLKNHLVTFMSAYAADSVLINEIDKISEVDPTLGLKKKYTDYYKVELQLIKEFNNFFYAIESKKEKTEIELIRNNLMNLVTEMTKKENICKSAEKYFKEKYKLE